MPMLILIDRAAAGMQTTAIKQLIRKSMRFKIIYLLEIVSRLQVSHSVRIMQIISQQVQ